MSIAPYGTTYGVTELVSDDAIVPGDIVSVQAYGSHKEGLVVGSYIDHAGRTVVEVQLEAGEVYKTWYPAVTRVRRTTYLRPPTTVRRSVERRIYW